MQTALPVLRKQKKPVPKLCVDTVPFQVSASLKKKRGFFFCFPSGLFFALFIDAGMEKGGNAERKLIFNSQKQHMDFCILQFTSFYEMKNHLNNDALKKITHASLIFVQSFVWVFLAIVVSRRWVHVKKSLMNVWMLFYSL